MMTQSMNFFEKAGEEHFGAMLMGLHGKKCDVVPISDCAFTSTNMGCWINYICTDQALKYYQSFRRGSSNCFFKRKGLAFMVVAMVQNFCEHINKKISRSSQFDYNI